jgi:hypothetical protein
MAKRLRDVIEDAYVDGRYCYSTFRKVSATAAVAGFWVDLSMATGNPVPNYYVGPQLTATIPTAWYKKSIWHGGGVSPNKKYLHKLCILGTAAAVAPAPFLLCDYLMYYPLIDMDSTDEQLLTNYGPVASDILDPNAATLPRYTDGKGVMAFLVATNPYVGGQSFQIRYTNSDGAPNRVSSISVTNTSTNIGTIVNSSTAGVNRYGAFIQLKEGDIGIRSVQSVTFMGSNGGLATLVLVRPLATMMTRDPGAWAEFDFIKDKPSLPRIYDDAFLGFLAMPSATIATIPVIGEITTIWGE